MKPIKVLVVDDQVLFREALVRLISSQEDMEVVGQASNGKEALDRVKQLQPNLVLMDIRRREPRVRVREQDG